jgi:phosphohistidine swiveling domain-containing protein
MTPEQIKKQILKFNDWEYWFERPFGAFILSLFIGGVSRQSMQRLGFNIEHPAALFDNGAWYSSNGVYEEAGRDIKREIKNGLSVRRVAESCERFREEKRAKIIKLIKNKNQEAGEKFKEVVEILKLVTSYIWLAHDFEYYYAPIFRHAVAKNFRGDIDKLVGDLSYPEKKNSHNYLDEELLSGVDAKILVRKYGWMKVRDGFTDPYTVKEFEELRSSLKSAAKREVVSIKVPAVMKELTAEMRELVYYRTLRTDVFYELIFLARPITTEVGKKFGLTFKELRNYSVYDLLIGKPTKYPALVSCAYYKDQFAFFRKPIFKENKQGNQEIKGVVAYGGKARGRVKVIRNVESLGKMEVGDILVAPMTSPNFLIAMQKAAAFVTDEGGITCHAAIVAREMKKPCIIGTKIATKVLRDGDLVEVDADNGIVRIIK